MGQLWGRPAETSVTLVTDPAPEAAETGSVANQQREIAMKANVGGIDRVLRILAGLGILSLVFVLEGPARWWGLAGLVPLLTGAFSFCPVYPLLGINTCPLEKTSA